MMAVVRGRVKICIYSADGKELVLNIIDRGGMFGEIALLDGQPRSADAVAIEDTELLVLDRNRLMPFLTANPEIATRMIVVLCQRLRQTSEALEDALLRDAPSRVARGLLRLAATFGKQEPAGLRLDIKLSQQQIGNLIGISRESINKYIVEWTRAGYPVGQRWLYNDPSTGRRWRTCRKRSFKPRIDGRIRRRAALCLPRGGGIDPICRHR